MAHKCYGCKYKGEHQEMMFKPMGVCHREHNLIEAVKAYNAEKCPFTVNRFGEWISVDERLPTHEDGKVLIYTAYGISIAEKTVSNRWKGDNAIPKQITHWMSLPEPPKMKGGAE